MLNDMLKTLTLTLALVFALAPSVRGQREATETGKPVTPEQELMALDLSWHEAVAARDAATLGRLLADDYRFDLDARRMLTKAQEAEAVAASDPLFVWGAFKLSETSSKVEGERALHAHVRPPGRTLAGPLRQPRLAGGRRAITGPAALVAGRPLR
jgi:hypothetical protein